MNNILLQRDALLTIYSALSLVSDWHARSVPGRAMHSHHEVPTQIPRTALTHMLNLTANRSRQDCAQRPSSRGAAIRQ
jgi:hypothetical protein